MIHSINRDQRLYVLPCGNGYSCLGFDVAHKRTASYAEWLKRPDLMPPARKGTKKAYRAYEAAQAAVLKHCRDNRTRCPVELTPALIGLEGKRVEVIQPDGEARRFIVGKSMGPIPIHLEIARHTSSGGGGVYWPAGTRISRIL